MNWLWVYWPCALAFIFLVLFAIPEYLAIKHQGPTFSRFMAHMARGTRFGVLWTLAWGLLIGGLAVHFAGWCVKCPAGGC